MDGADIKMEKTDGKCFHFLGENRNNIPSFPDEITSFHNSTVLLLDRAQTEIASLGYGKSQRR